MNPVNSSGFAIEKKKPITTLIDPKIFVAI